MDNRLALSSLSLRGVIGSATLLSALFPVATAAADQADFSPADSCAERIRVIDDRGDLAVREANQEIARLRTELASRNTAADTTRAARIRTELAAARTRRSEILRDQHSILNDVRAQCESLRTAARQATAES